MRGRGWWLLFQKLQEEGKPWANSHRGGCTSPGACLSLSQTPGPQTSEEAPSSHCHVPDIFPDQRHQEFADSSGPPTQTMNILLDFTSICTPTVLSLSPSKGPTHQLEKQKIRVFDGLLFFLSIMRLSYVKWPHISFIVSCFNKM